MDDSTLENEIESLLLVEPAADFRVRIRQRLAAEPELHRQQRSWRLAWILGCSGAVAATAAALVIVLRMDAPPERIYPFEAHVMPQATRTAISPAVVSRPVASTASRRPRSPAPVAWPMEVVVHRSEAAAWRRLLGDLNAGEMELSFPSGADGMASSAPSDDFLLPAIVIEPLALTLTEQGAHP